MSATKHSNILIVEDEHILLDVLSKKMEQEGYKVVKARDGEEAIKKIKEGGLDIILLDMLLPRLDGFGVLERLKKDGVKTPVIVLSNSGQPVDIDRALALGASDYLIKSEFEPQEVLKKVNRCLSPEHRKTRESKVLIVEDDKFLRDLCLKKILSYGYKVETAEDGDVGYEKIVKNTPDLVLLDIIMPGTDGFNVLTKVRKHKSKKIADTPIVMMTNLGQSSDVERAKELGANGYFIKANLSMDEIADKIKEYIKT